MKDERIGCFFKSHPDFNFSNRTFHDSEIWRFYLKNKKQGIQSDLRYSLTQNQFIPIDKKAWVSNPAYQDFTFTGSNAVNPHVYSDRVGKRKPEPDPKVEPKPKAAGPRSADPSGRTRSSSTTPTPEPTEPTEHHRGPINNFNEMPLIKLFQFKISI